MGAGQSKPDESTKHVFTSDTPINFSPELVESLQASSETNSTRAKSLELHIAKRVAAELEKLQNRETSTLESIQKKIASGEESSSKDSLSSSTSVSPKDLLTSTFTGSKEEKQRKAQTSQKVQEEIEKLKQSLGQRKVVKDLPKDVEKARQGLISCLRLNDRTPLDCYKEVEVFKREVRKMEDSFVSGLL